MPEAGHRVEAVVHEAMARSEKVRTVQALADASGVERGTIYFLFNGREPKPNTMQAIADALTMPVGDLWAAWDGRPPRSADVVEALAAQTQAISELVERLDRLAEVGGEALAAVLAATSLQPGAGAAARERAAASRPRQ